MRKKQLVKEEAILLEAENFQYPDFKLDVQTLQKRLLEVGEEHRPVIERWVLELSRIHKEMRHLERIENFSTALTSPLKSDDID